MNWKKWPYWVRGGVIGGGVALLSTVVSFLVCSSPDLLCTVLSFQTFPLLPLVPFTINIPNDLFSAFVVIGSTVVWFLIGAILGGVIGRLEKKKIGSSSLNQN